MLLICNEQRFIMKGKLNIIYLIYYNFILTIIFFSLGILGGVCLETKFRQTPPRDFCPAGSIG